jgi:hypothetical protein
MTNWDRREAGLLADAIGKHCQKHPDQVGDDNWLMVIRIAADNASTTIDTSGADIAILRSQICSICLRLKLYDCNAPTERLRDCELVRANASEFAAL